MPPQDQNNQNSPQNYRPQSSVDPFTAAPHLSPDEAMMRQYGQQQPQQQYAQKYNAPSASQPQQFPSAPVVPQEYPNTAPLSPMQQASPRANENQQYYTSQNTPPAPLSNYQNSYQQPSYQPYQAPKSSKRFILLLASVVGLVLLAGGGAFAYVSMRATPDSVFADAVENSLTTRQVKQVLDTDGGSVTLLYDVSAAKDPRVQTITKADVLGINIDMTQYSDLKNSYVKYDSFGNLFTGNSPASAYKGKWMQTRIDGKAQEENASGLNTILTDSYYTLFGDWIFGNFSVSDKSELKKIILDDKVYGYDAGKVQKKTISGQEMYAYDIKENTDALIKLNKKVAAIWGVDSQDIEDQLKANSLGEGKTTIYLNIKTKQIVQIEAELNGQKASTKYTDYNNLNVPAKPTVQADYLQFGKAMDASPSLF